MKISGKNRPLGTYIAGNPGYGKSSLIQRMALQDIKKGYGVCVVDPTGDLVNTLIHHIPASRIKDTIYFDTNTPIPIDFFSYHNDPKEQEILVDDIVQIFDVATAKRAKPLLITLLYTLFEANENGGNCTFLDIGKFLMYDARKNAILKSCSEARQHYWETARINSDVYDTIVSRIVPFLESATLRTIVGSPNPKLTISDVMQKGQIFLVNIEDTPTDLLIASLIVSKFQQAAFRRRDPKIARTPYYLYIDECHTIIKFAVESFEKILTRARKYNLCITLANQIPDDLPEPILRKIGTIGNLILFNLNTKDARHFKDSILPYSIDHLVNLPQFYAITRTQNDATMNTTLRFLPPSRASYAKEIKKRTLDTYACDPIPNRYSSSNDPKPDPSPTGKPKNLPPDKDQRKSP
jgi:hypothetical protein